MALGRRRSTQNELFITFDKIAQAPAHPFYSRLEEVFKKYAFDAFCEDLCEPYYSNGVGRPGLPPGVYFRLVMLGYFERIPSERQIAWRIADSLSLRGFVGYSLTQATPDHSTISKTRRRLPISAHEAVFAKVLEILVKENLLRGEKIGVDATLLEANASMKCLVHKVTGESYKGYLASLAAQDPNEPDDPGPEDLARFDRRRKGKKLSNKDWKNPHNPDAKIAKMKAGHTHFAEKCEHAVDLDTGAIVAVTVQGADLGDTTTIDKTVETTINNLETIEESLKEQKASTPKHSGRPHKREVVQHIVADKGYNSMAVCDELTQKGIQPVISEPKRGRRKWKGKRRQQQAFYNNRKNIRSEAGKAIIKKRGELVERAFAHYLDAGGMRRVFLKGHENIGKRLLIHVAGFNLGILMRKVLGAGTPRAWAELRRNLSSFLGLFFGFKKHHSLYLESLMPKSRLFADDYPCSESVSKLAQAA